MLPQYFFIDKGGVEHLGKAFRIGDYLFLCQGLFYCSRGFFLLEGQLALHYHLYIRMKVGLYGAVRVLSVHQVKYQFFNTRNLLAQSPVFGNFLLRDDTAQFLCHFIIGIVYDANDKMAEKLSRIITEKEIAKHRRLRKQIAGIKELIFDLMDGENPNCAIQTNFHSDVKMVMERKLTFQQKKATATVKQPLAQEQVIADPERFSKMLNTSFIDKKILWQHVEAVLKNQSTATLKEILEQRPPENGLAEIVSYYSFIKDKKGKVQIIEKTSELIPLNSEKTKFAEVPYLLFSK